MPTSTVVPGGMLNALPTWKNNSYRLFQLPSVLDRFQSYYRTWSFLSTANSRVWWRFWTAMKVMPGW